MGQEHRPRIHYSDMRPETIVLFRVIGLLSKLCPVVCLLDLEDFFIITSFAEKRWVVGQSTLDFTLSATGRASH